MDSNSTEPNRTVKFLITQKRNVSSEPKENGTNYCLASSNQNLLIQYSRFNTFFTLDTNRKNSLHKITDVLSYILSGNRSPIREFICQTPVDAILTSHIHPCAHYFNKQANSPFCGEASYNQGSHDFLTYWLLCKTIR